MVEFFKIENILLIFFGTYFVFFLIQPSYGEHGSVEVTMSTGNGFIPSEVTIHSGDTVIWNNLDTVTHSISSGTLQEGNDGYFDSGLLGPGQTFSVTFETAGPFPLFTTGPYPYYDPIHPYNTGIVNVEPRAETDGDVIGDSCDNIQIPVWIKNNAKWWSKKLISDADFIAGIEFLIAQDVIRLPIDTPSKETGDSQEIPSWIKNTAGWWGEELISDCEFVKAFEYLIIKGIIRI